MLRRFDHAVVLSQDTPNRGRSGLRHLNTILVLGGYGGFGARLSRRLAAAGHDVIVAGPPSRARYGLLRRQSAVCGPSRPIETNQSGKFWLKSVLIL